MKKPNTANFAPVALIKHIREMQSKIDDLTKNFNEAIDIERSCEGNMSPNNDISDLIKVIAIKDDTIMKLKKQYFDLINTKHISIEQHNDKDLELKNRKLEADKSIYKMTIQLQDEKIRRLGVKNSEKNHEITELKRVMQLADKYHSERNESWEIKEGLVAECLGLARNIDKAIENIDYITKSKNVGGLDLVTFCKNIKDLLNGKYPKESDKFKVS